VRIKPLILLILIVVLPLGGLIWLGLRVARDDEAALQRRFEKVFAVQLRDIDGVINRHFESLSTELRGTARQIRFEPDDIRAVIRTAPQVRQVIVLDREGLVLHPDPATPLSLSEREFLNEAQELIQDRDLIHASSGQFDASTQRPITPGKLPRGDQRVSSTVGSSSPDEGWHTWYWGRGVHLIFWQRRADGSVVGLLVERGRWMADLVAALPDTVNRQHDGVSIATTSRFRLVDSMGQSMYEWGEYEPPEVCTPLAEMAVSSPLNSWRLQAVVSESLLAGESRGTAFQLTT
jgi:hypothetical protein